jgi:hypothetical protein
MKYFLPFALVFFLIGASNTHAQDLHFPGYAPSVSVSAPVTKKLDLNFLAASKVRSGTHTVKGIQYNPLLLELYTQALVTIKLNNQWQLGSGYGFQRNNPFRDEWRNEHRLVQQVQFIIPGKHLKFYQRARFEERWFNYPDNPSSFGTRARYQAGLIKPFKKTYWQLNNEIYFITSGPRNALIAENWIYTGYGFPVKSLGRLETGVGINSVVRNSSKDVLHLYLFQLAWSYTLPSKHKKEMHPVMQERHF